MRSRPNRVVEAGRIRGGKWGTSAGNPCGFFVLECFDWSFKVIASDGELPVMPWEHVSVSMEDAPPPWDLMATVKSWWWKPEEAVMQLHPPASSYVSFHPNCLHLWRPLSAEIPLPPVSAVGPPGLCAAGLRR